MEGESNHRQHASSRLSQCYHEGGVFPRVWARARMCVVSCEGSAAAGIRACMLSSSVPNERVTPSHERKEKKKLSTSSRRRAAFAFGFQVKKK